MGHTLATVVLPYKSGLPRDCSMNSFHFWTEDAADQTTFDYIGALLVATYNGGTLGDKRVGGVDDIERPGIAYGIGDFVIRTADACVVRFYDVSTSATVPSGGQEVSPLLYEFPFTLGPITGTPDSFPLEVASCVSFEGFTVVGGGTQPPQRRRRGRVYIGPLNGNIQSLVSNNPSRVDSQWMHDMVDAFTYMAIHSFNWALGVPTTLDDVVWCSYSPTQDLTSGSANSLCAVASVWCDNEWDTQRRRGTRADARTDGSIASWEFDDGE